jgi:hypothetical protein
MNSGPGNYCMSVWLAGFVLWLTSMVLPVFATAEPLAPGVPSYNPWSVTHPYNQYDNLNKNQNENQSKPQPQPQPTQPQVQPQPLLQPQFQPRFQPPVAGPGFYNRPPPVQQPFGAPPRWAYPPSQATPGYQPQQPAQVQASRPYLETSVDSTSAYVHQNLVMTIQVISTVNLKTASAELQDTDDVIFRQLGDIKVSTRTKQGQREIVNTLYFQLTPLRSGRIDLDSIRVTGIMEGGTPDAVSYDAVASLPEQLMVLDPDPSVQPWLPLHELELSARLTNDERIGEGEPLTLTVEQRAVGMSGAQLPSLESQLQAPGHRLYREKSEYEGTITKEGTLIGSRIDRFTLVPQQGNQVKIPAIRVDWWNVERQRKETAVLPGRFLNELVRGSGEDRQAGGLEAGRAPGPLLMWLALLAIAFLLGRFWLSLVPGLKYSGRWLWQWLYSASRPLHRHLEALLVRVSPRRNLHLLRRRIAESLPRSARLWFCVRSADEEQDADDWSQVLRFLINRRLRLPAHLPMSKLAEHIIEIHPGADPDRIRCLLGELEEALFAGRPIQDFDAWKKEFKYQVRPRLFAGLRRRQRYFSATGLPSLNPTVS